MQERELAASTFSVQRRYEVRGRLSARFCETKPMAVWFNLIPAPSPFIARSSLVSSPKARQAGFSTPSQRGAEGRGSYRHAAGRKTGVHSVRLIDFLRPADGRIEGVYTLSSIGVSLVI